MNQEKIGKFIANMRKKKNMTQEMLAEKLGVSNKSISRWETGKCMPDISLLEPLSIELGITVNELIKGDIILEKNIKNDTDNNLKNSLNEINKSKKTIKKLLIISLSLTLFIFVIQLFNINNISFSSFKIINYSEKFYSLLKSNSYSEIENFITEEYVEDQWHTSITNYDTKDFINGLKEMSKNNIKYDSFVIDKFGYNGDHFVEYKMCFKDNNERACVNIKIFESNKEKDRYLFWVVPIEKENELQKYIINIFNPIWYVN